MKRFVILAAAVVGLLAAKPAHAQFLVEDIDAVKQLYLDYAIQLKEAASQLQLVATSAQQLQWAVNQYNSFVAYPSLANAMGLLNAIGIPNPLPFSPYAIQSVISGHGGAGGLQSITSSFSQLASFTNQAVGNNHVYTCTSGTWQCQEQIAGAYGIGGSQGLSQTMMSQMSQHVPVLQGLRADLMNATTPAEREAAMGQIQSETAWMQQTNVQMQAAASMSAIESENRQQRADEHLHGCIEAQLAMLQAAGITTGLTLSGNGGCSTATGLPAPQIAAAANPDMPVAPN